MNYADSERFNAVLNQHGMEYTEIIKDADLVLINSCSVRQKAEDRIIGLGRKMVELKAEKPELQIILTGCMAGRSWQGNTPEKYYQKLYKVMPWLNKIVETKNLPAYIYGLSEKNLFDFVPITHNNTHGLIPISSGCDHFCTYCIVPFARGKERCRPFKEIQKDFEYLLKKGFKDITLLGQTVNRWTNPDESDVKSFLQLIKALDSVEGNYWLSFMSSHPNYMNNDIIDFLAESKHFRPYFHFALQSGSDKILARMNRGYTYENFRDIALYYKSKLPDAILSTDIITGFSGETDADFNKTANAMRELKFDTAYISEYSPREGTASARLKDDVPNKVKAERKTYLNDKILAISALKNNTKLIGKSKTCLVEEILKNHRILARLDNNKEVLVSVIEQAKELVIKPNMFIKVKITSCTPWALAGELCGNPTEES